MPDGESSRAATRRTRLATCAALLVPLLAFVIPTAEAQAPAGASAARQKTVLLLHSYHPGYEWTDEIDRAVRQRLQEMPYDLEVRTEYMDTKRYAGDAYLKRLEAYLAPKYEHVRFDLVVATDDAAVAFAMAHHQSLLHGAPVVFCGVNDEHLAATVPRQSFTGLIEVFSAAPMLETALRLHPTRRKVIVATDSTTVGEVTLHQIAEVMDRHPGTSFRLLDGRAYSFDEILDAIRTAGDDTIVFASQFQRDRDGRYYPRGEGNARIAQASPAPVYSPSVSQLGQGILGGSQNTGRQHGAAVSKIVQSVLQGTPPSAIPIVEEQQDLMVFDDQQLRRWGIDHAELPAGTEIVNAPADPYRRFRPYFLGVLAFIAFQSSVIGALVFANRRRRRAEVRVQQQADALRSVNQELAEANTNLQGEMAERRRAEAEKDRLNARLNEAQRIEAVGQLAGGVAHDFNNLLSVILGHAELAMDATPEGDAWQQDLREVQLAGNRAATLTRQLLAFGRKQVLRPVRLDLNEVTARMEGMLRPLLGEAVSLHVTSAPDLGTTLADRGQIEQVLVNLVLNARDAMPSGGTITLETASVDVDPLLAARLGLARAGRYVRLSVSDTGVGMDAATRARAFEPFFTTKALGQGTGLGLSVAHGIVTQSGGAIAVESEPGRGSRFDIFLPRDEGAQAESDHAATPTGARGPRGTETVLIVEDEPAVRALTQRVVSAAGYRVLSAAGGEEALALLAAHGDEIAIVLTDVVMPGMSGPVLAGHVARVCPRAKVLFMSGYADEAVSSHGLPDAGAHLVAKPFSAAELTRRIRDTLDEARPATTTAN